MGRAVVKLPQKFNFSTEIPVRITDLNYAGHLANDKVLSVAHEARLRFLNKYDITEMDVAGYATIMVDAVVVYKAQGFFGDRLKVEVTVDNFTKYGCDFLYKISNTKNDQEIARVKTGLVFFDYSKNKIIHAPQIFFDKFDGFLRD